MLTPSPRGEVRGDPDPTGTLSTTNVIQRLAAELAGEPAPMLAVAVDWIATRLPDYVERVEAAGEDLEIMSSTILDILVAAVQSDGELSLYEYWDAVRDLGRRRCEQGFDMETLLEVLSVHRDVLIEVFDSMLREIGIADRMLRHAERRLDVLIEKLSVSMTLGYLDAVEARYEEQRGELEALIAITRSLNRSLEIRDVADAGLQETTRAVRVEAGALWLADADGSLGVLATVGLTAEESELLEGWPVAESGFLASLLAGNSPIQDSVRPRVAPLRRFRSALGVPLRNAQGELLGILTIGTARARTFKDSEVAFVGAVADHLVVALEHARQHQREARTDFLTGLANRHEFERSTDRLIAGARRKGTPLTLALLDLDNLKTINDTLGHHAGDKAIRAVGSALRQAVRASDVSARIGGDEFAVALPDLDLDQAVEVARRIGRTLSESTEVGALPVSVSVSFGFARWTKGMDWNALFGAADAELYRAKRKRGAGRGAPVARRRRRRTSHDSSHGVSARAAVPNA